MTAESHPEIYTRVEAAVARIQKDYPSYSVPEIFIEPDPRDDRIESATAVKFSSTILITPAMIANHSVDTVEGALVHEMGHYLLERGTTILSTEETFAKSEALNRYEVAQRESGFAVSIDLYVGDSLAASPELSFGGMEKQVRDWISQQGDRAKHMQSVFDSMLSNYSGSRQSSRDLRGHIKQEVKSYFASEEVAKGNYQEFLNISIERRKANECAADHFSERYSSDGAQGLREFLTSRLHLDARPIATHPFRKDRIAMLDGADLDFIPPGAIVFNGQCEVIGHKSPRETPNVGAPKESGTGWSPEDR